MSRFRWPKVLFITVFLCSCGKSLPVLEGVDQTSWKNDKNACAGKRTGMINDIESQKAKLLSLNELEIVALLGKPDQNELYTRNQKFYYYFLEPSPACDSSDAEHKKRLVVRFNAMGLASEILVEQ